MHLPTGATTSPAIQRYMAAAVAASPRRESTAAMHLADALSPTAKRMRLTPALPTTTPPSSMAAGANGASASRPSPYAGPVPALVVDPPSTPGHGDMDDPYDDAPWPASHGISAGAGVNRAMDAPGRGGGGGAPARDRQRKRSPRMGAAGPAAASSYADKNSKGLRHFSLRVCQKVEEKGCTTYNEVRCVRPRESPAPPSPAHMPETAPRHSMGARLQVADELVREIKELGMTDDVRVARHLFFFLSRPAHKRTVWVLFRWARSHRTAVWARSTTKRTCGDACTTRSTC